MTDRALTADLPLSPAQEQLWFLQQLSPQAGLYNEITALRLRGPLDPELLGRSLDRLALRHESLRATFPTVAGGPVCRYLPALGLHPGAARDLGGRPDAERLAIAIACEFADEPYDLASGPLVRSALLRFRDDDHLLLLGFHHLVCDGASMNILLAELDELMRAGATGREPALPELTARYRDHVQHQRTAVPTPEEAAFWRELVTAPPVLLDLNVGRPRPPVKATTGQRLHLELATAPAAALGAFAARESTTATCVLLAAFATVLHRHTGAEDIVLGTAADGRGTPELERVVGFFTNTVPLRLRPAPRQRFRDLLAETTGAVLDGLDFQDTPFTHVVELLSGRDPSIPPLVQVVVAHVPKDSTTVPVGDLAASEVPVPRGRGRFDLLVEAELADGRTRLAIEFDDSIFPVERVHGLARHLAAVLRAVLLDAELTLAHIPMLDDAERALCLPAPVDATVEVVLLGDDTLAPLGATGRVHRIAADRVRLHDDILGQVSDPGVDPSDTGRLGYRDLDGHLIDLGPADRFVTAHGVRVGLDGVQRVLRTLPGAAAATVSLDPAGAMVVDGVDATADPAGLWERALRVLPRYAVPDCLDPAARADDDTGDDDTAALAVPVDPALATLRSTLLDLWRRELGDPALGVDDDLFDRGGHSMLAARLALLARDELALEVSVRQVFEHPTVASLARVLAGEQPEAVATLHLVAGLAEEEFLGLAPGPGDDAATGPRPTAAPLTGAQRQIWVMDKLAPHGPAYNIPLRFELTGPLDVPALTTAIGQLLARHEALRCVYLIGEDGPIQVPGAAPALLVEDLRGLGRARAALAADRIAAAEATTGFSLETEPPLRARLLRIDDDTNQLLLTVHHIAIDQVGLAALRRDLCLAYDGAREGRPPAWPPLPMSWLDYARWEREWLAGPDGERLRRFWREELRGVAPLRLPTGSRRPGWSAFDGAHRSRPASAALLDAVTALARATRATPFVVFSAACAVLVSRLSGQDEFVIGTPAENRQRVGAADLVGCAVNLIPLRVDLSGGASFGEVSFAELVGRLRRVTLDAYDHQGLPLPEIAALAGQPGGVGQPPLVHVTTGWQVADDLDLRLGECAGPGGYVSTRSSRMSISFTATVTSGQLGLGVEFSTDLFSPADIDELLEQLEEILVAAHADPTAPVRVSELARDLV